MHSPTPVQATSYQDQARLAMLKQFLADGAPRLAPAQPGLPGGVARGRECGQRPPGALGRARGRQPVPEPATCDDMVFLYTFGTNMAGGYAA